MLHPYQELPNKNFWKTGVQLTNIFEADIYTKKFDIDRHDYIATAGSCFAQHVAIRLRKAGYNYLDVEKAPLGLPEDVKNKFGYQLYSARFGNIYTARQLLQLVKEAVSKEVRAEIWEKDGRYYDSLRPSVEPFGLPSPEHVISHREYHLKQVILMIKEMDVFIFTLGLTEGWISKENGTVFPIAPGVRAGRFESDKYLFHNFTHLEILDDLLEFFDLAKKIRKGKICKYIFTVSPVPLTATATKNHIIVSTTHSKSTLRSVAGELESNFENIDYFPSYEVITSPLSRGVFYEGNMRSVCKSGVDVVMSHFFKQHPPFITRKNEPDIQDDQNEKDDVVCDEALYEGFSSK